MNVFTKIIAGGLVALAMGAVDASAQSQPPADPAPLTPAQIKTVVEGRLIMHRSDLKVGKIIDKDAKTYDVELVKPDGAVQEHALVDKTYARPAGALSHGGPGFGGPGFSGKHGHMGMGGGMGGGMGCGQPG